MIKASHSPFLFVKKHQQSNGFTLLEVLIAITLTALVLGSLFALKSKSHQLQFKSIEKTHQQLQLKAAFNLALLDMNEPKIASFKKNNLTIEETEETSTLKIKELWKVQSFDITDDKGEVYLSSANLIENKK